MLGELFSGLAKIASKVADFFSDSEEKRPAIENKTDSGKKTIQFSSIAAWDDSKLPKIVIVWKIKKILHKIPNVRKRRDLEGKIESYSIHYIEDSSIVVPWVDNPSHSDITKWKWNEERDRMLKLIIDQQNNEYPKRQIVLSKTCKNGNPPNATCRIQCHVRDYTNLPRLPISMTNTEWHNDLTNTLDQMCGARIRIKKKNRPGLTGRRVFATGEILEMEHNEKRRLEGTGVSSVVASARSKDPGYLFITLEDDNQVQEIPDFSSGREDHWLGDAIDDIMAFLNHKLTKSKSKTIGTDILAQEDSD